MTTTGAPSKPDSTYFTVVIPTHNARPSIVRSVSSVLGQSHPHFELVVVCDGDAARTRALLADVDDPRLRIVEQPRSGVSRARNLGVRSGRHAWVTFLDDDDIARPYWLEAWAKGIDVATVALTANLAFWEGTHIAATRECRLRLDDLTMGASSILPGGFAVRRELIESIGGFDEALDYSENQDLGLRLLEKLDVADSSAIVHISEVLVDFQREAASTRARRYRGAPARSARVFLSRYMRRLECDPPTKASLLRIISRAARQEHQPRTALSAALGACRAQPTFWANYRSLALAVLSTPPAILIPRRRRLQGENQ